MGQKHIMPKHTDKVNIFPGFENTFSGVDDKSTELALRRAMFKQMRPDMDASRHNAIGGGGSGGNTSACR